MIGAGNVTRNCKGDHAVATGRSDTRALARKRFNGLVKRIACTVGLVLGLTHEIKLFVPTFDVFLQGLFELVEVIFEAVFDERRRHEGATQGDHVKFALIAYIVSVVIDNGCQPTRRSTLIVRTFGPIVQVRLVAVGTCRPHGIGVELGSLHLARRARQEWDLRRNFFTIVFNV